MADFCECGSLVIDNRCSNKNCSLRAAGNPASEKKTSSRAKTAVKKAGMVKAETAKAAAKTTSSRRASKCITYNLNDLKEKEPEN